LLLPEHLVFTSREPGRFDLIGLETELIDEPLPLAFVGSQRPGLAPDLSQLAYEAGYPLPVFLQARERIERRELVGRPQNRKVIRLPVDIDRALRERLELLDGRRLAVQPRSGPAREPDRSFEDDRALGQGKGCLDGRPLRAGRDDLAAPARAENERQRIDHERLACAGLAREHVEARAGDHDHRFRHSEPGDGDPLKHGAGSPCL
jgi:hypothetical protein